MDSLFLSLSWSIVSCVLACVVLRVGCRFRRSLHIKTTFKATLINNSRIITVQLDTTMASALAHPIFRTSSIEQGLHVNGITDEATHYHGSADHRLPSSLPPAPMFLKDISRSSSGSTQGSIGMVYQPNFHTRSASLSQGRVEEYNRQQQHQQNRGMLPGLSTLASLASTKEPYMRSFPAATAMGISFGQMVPALTPGVSGNNNLPVSFLQMQL